MKKIYLIVLVVLLVFTVVACSQENAETTTQASPGETEGEMIELTLEELSQFNGKDGNKAYVAVDGIIYDVTDVPQWQGGSHNGNTAGQDVSDQIANLSPHGKRVLNNLTVVGTLVEE
ncbi:MAG: cytochrome b5 domain-containing protein [Eubacteriales bacterium]|nr:cytochrome b5 domain-containing protein [Eubacteriales bacterium]